MKKKSKADEKTRMMLRVPNTEEGKAFLKQLKGYRVQGLRVWARGRGTRAKQSHIATNGHSGRIYDQSLPQAFAEYFGVYLWKEAYELEAAKRDGALISERWKMIQENQRLQSEVSELRDAREKWSQHHEVKRLETDRAELMHQRDALQSELERQRNINRTLRNDVERMQANQAHDGQHRTGKGKVINLTIVIPEEGKYNA